MYWQKKCLPGFSIYQKVQSGPYKYFCVHIFPGSPYHNRARHIKTQTFWFPLISSPLGHPEFYSELFILGFHFNGYHYLKMLTFYPHPSFIVLFWTRICSFPDPQYDVVAIPWNKKVPVHREIKLIIITYVRL